MGSSGKEHGDAISDQTKQGTEGKFFYAEN
jgi:hypothetical protein